MRCAWFQSRITFRCPGSRVVTPPLQFPPPFRKFLSRTRVGPGVAADADGRADCAGARCVGPGLGVRKSPSRTSPATNPRHVNSTDDVCNEDTPWAGCCEAVAEQSTRFSCGCIWPAVARWSWTLLGTLVASRNMRVRKNAWRIQSEMHRGPCAILNMWKLCTDGTCDAK